MSLCDVCPAPGRCCSGFPLNFHPEPDTALEALVRLATVRASDENGVREPDEGLPFVPLFKDSRGGWRYWCPHLEGGRCGIYEDRPNLCRSFTPGIPRDKLCCLNTSGTTSLMAREGATVPALTFRGSTPRPL